MDTIEAKKNLEIYRSNLGKLQTYNHLYSSNTFKDEYERVKKELIKRIENLEDAFAKEAKRNKAVAMR
ncbi:conserved hypothetical protein [Acinetobacter proteolyticus]|uniref:Uncharacterized protein n=1 Tax=Acinetobacter proteolyticus TaxID=1776741 RepID=A0A653K3D0_9GAMM|nr:hypothetical protein [Acinetobacter proteolyticus]VXA55331.1 conserved hypothetical protein [Acinetobacter proteolyticus]